MLALSAWWLIGWMIGVVVVVIAATVLLTIIGLGRRIVRQADEITASLDATRSNTDPLWNVKQINLNIDRINKGLAAARRALGG
jgi:hypothetical protein